jgi:hypothetical protein
MMDREYNSRTACGAGVSRRRPGTGLRIALLLAAIAMLLFSAATPAGAQGIQVTNTSFPATYTSQSTQQNVTLTVGADAVVINSIQVPFWYSDFEVTGTPTCAMGTVLAPGTVCTAAIYFQPSKPGYAVAPAPIGRWAPLQIQYVDQVTGQPQTELVPLTGSGSNPHAAISPGLISDIVGNDTTPHSGFGGDGGAASGAVFAVPSAIAMDVLGNMYIADSGNNVVRVVYASGTIPNVASPVAGYIYTIAGVPTAAGPGVDGVQATSSPLSNPIGVAVDALGNIYISDSNNGAVRMVSAATGIITTVAGTLNSSTPGFAGDGGPATAAVLSVPSGISVDGNGNLFIADSNNDAVRVVYAGGAQLAALIALEIPGTTAVPGDIYTIAGGPANLGLPNNGDGGLASLSNLNSPAAVVTDSAGDIYIADFGNIAVRRVDAVTGNISSVYQGVDGPTNLAVDASDSIYFTGHTYCTVWQYNPSVQTGLSAPATTMVAGNGICTASGDGNAATSAGLSGAESVVADGLGNLYVLEADGVRLVNTQQSSFNFGTVNLGSGNVLTAVMTDDDILPSSGLSPNLLQAPAFQLGFASPELFSVVPYAATNPNVFDCDAPLTNNYLLPGQSCGVAIAFQPVQDGGPFTGYAYNPATNASIALSGSATGSLPTAALTGTPVNFVSVVNEGFSAPQMFMLTNTGSTPLTIYSISFGSPGSLNFYESDTCGYYNGATYGPSMPLAGGASCTISVSFFATSTGSASATLSVLDNASSGGGTQTLSMTGTGTAPQGVFTISPPTGLAAAPGAVSATAMVTLLNQGNAPLHLNTSSWGFSGNDPSRFGIVSNNCGVTVLAGASCMIGVNFSPPTYGYYAANLMVQDDSGGVRIVNSVYQYITQDEPLAGDTGNPPAQLTSYTLGNAVFPPTAVGQSITQTVTLTLNNAVALNAIAIASGFGEYTLGTVAGCTIGGALNAAATVCSVPITFTPAAVGIRNAPLQVVDVEAHGPVPYAFGLSGTGTGPLASLTPGIITTLIGSSNAVAVGIAGADGPGPQAAVGFQSSMAIDSLGQIFVADTLNNVIWKTDTSGNIHLYAGTPFPQGGYIEPIAGEGGTALGAELGQAIGGLALDAKGGLYFVDGADNYGNPTRIRYIDPVTSMISTAVGFVPPGAWASATSFATTTQIVVALGADKYLFTALQGGSSGSVSPAWPASAGQTVMDGSVIWMNKGLYNGGNGCGAETDNLGDGCTALQVTLGSPGSMELDQAGNLYFTDSARVRRVDAVTGIVSVVAGNGISGDSGDHGPATSANINPGDLAFDGNGNLYFIDSLRYVRMVNMSTGIITTVSGDTIASSQIPGYCAGESGDGGPQGSAAYAGWNSLAIDAAGNIYLADQSACVVRRIDMGSQVIQTVAGSPNAQYPINSVGYGDAGQANSDGSALEASLNHPAQVRLDGLGNLYIGSAWGGVRKVNVSQSIVPFAGPYGQLDNSQQIDTVSAPMTETVLNAGNASLLHFNSPFISPSWGISNSNFIRDVTDPTGSADCYDLELLSAGFECPINVDFTPQAVSSLPLTAQDTITDDAANTPQTIQLTGFSIGPAPLVTLEPPLLSYFTPQNGTSTQPLTLTNNDTNQLPISSITITGTGASAFTSSNNCGAVLAATSTCTIMVTFSPPIAGPTSNPPPDVFKATAIVTDTAGVQTSQLAGVGTLPAALTSLNIQETLNISDAASLTPSTPLVINETINTSDNVPALVQSTLLTINETLHITDAGLPALAPVIIPIVESIHVTDVDSALAPIFIPIVESIHVTDVDSALAPIFIPITENIHVTDVPAIPAVSLSALSLSYGDRLVGTTSPSQSVTLSNIGPTPLSITSIAVTGANASSFVFTSSCGASLAARANCTIHGHFTPTTTGPLSAAVTITDSASGSPQSISLSGNGTAPTVTLSTTGLSFPTTDVGSTSTLPITVTNSGTGSLTVTVIDNSGANPTDFGHTSNCGGNPIAPGNYCTIQVIFTPATAGPYSATLNINDNASGSPQTVTLSGNGTAPTVTLSTTGLSFPSTNVGSKSTLPVTVTNSGATNLSVSLIDNSGLNPTDFSHTSNCGGHPITPGNYCTIQVNFTPASAGPFSATLNIYNNATGAPQTVTLSGNGNAPTVTLSTTALSFPTTNVGKTSTLPVTVTNSGTTNLTVSAIGNSGSNPTDFSHTSNCGGHPIAPGNYCTIQVIFTPGAASPYLATLNITDNATGSPQTVTLSGNGTAPTVTLSTTSLSFPSTNMGSTRTLPVTVTNTGTSNLTVSAIGNSGSNPTDFSHTSNCGGHPIAPGNYCTIQVNFIPAATGPLSATLNITDNATGSPQTVTLNGTGH